MSAAPNNTASSLEPSTGPSEVSAEKSRAPESDVSVTPAGTGTTPAAKAEPKSDSPTVDADTAASAVQPVSSIQELWASAKANGHPEIWGVTLADPESHVPTQIVLQKYLNANDGNLTKAKDQLIKTLEWRAKTKPLELLEKKYSQLKFGGLGYVTTYVQSETKEVFTWNVYGNVKKFDDTFGNLEEFIEWRVALMELALKDLSIQTATTPIAAENDPYKMFQVHDYKSISFFRSPPSVRAASSETIKVFAQNYPELLKEKFFVNVPAIMGFMYTFMKLFVAAKTTKKFHPMSNGGQLALEFKESKVEALGEKLPKEYGGKGVDLNVEGKETALE